MNTPVREGETIEGSRTMRNRPYLSSAQVLKYVHTEAKNLEAWEPMLGLDLSAARLVKSDPYDAHLSSSLLAK